MSGGAARGTTITIQLLTVPINIFQEKGFQQILLIQQHFGVFFLLAKEQLDPLHSRWQGRFHLKLLAQEMIS